MGMGWSPTLKESLLNLWGACFCISTHASDFVWDVLVICDIAFALSVGSIGEHMTVLLSLPLLRVCGDVSVSASEYAICHSRKEVHVALCVQNLVTSKLLLMSWLGGGCFLRGV